MKSEKLKIVNNLSFLAPAKNLLGVLSTNSHKLFLKFSQIKFLYFY